MRKRRVVLVVMRFVLALGFTGCEKNNLMEPATSDKDAMSSMVADDALFQADALLLNDGDPTTALSSLNSLGKVSTTIIPRTWGRKIESSSRQVNFTVLTDSTANAVVTNTLQGYIWITGKYSTQDSMVSTIKKNFTETILHNVKFVRINRTRDPRHNWKISEISAVKGGTAESQITITELRFYAANDTVIITDPLNTYLKLANGIGRFVPELTADVNTIIRIQATVRSSAPDSDFVYVHRPYFTAGQWQYRVHMTLVSSSSNGDGTSNRVYEVSWKGVWLGRHHVLVSAVSHGSILDDTTPFSSQIWGLPFIVQ